MSRWRRDWSSGPGEKIEGVSTGETRERKRRREVSGAKVGRIASSASCHTSGPSSAPLSHQTTHHTPRDSVPTPLSRPPRTNHQPIREESFISHALRNTISTTFTPLTTTTATPLSSHHYPPAAASASTTSSSPTHLLSPNAAAPT